MRALVDQSQSARVAAGFDCCRDSSTPGNAPIGWTISSAPDNKRFVDPGSEPLPPELAQFWRIDDGRTACERAAAFGIDLSLLDENLRLMPSERLSRNDAALDLPACGHPP